jgi:hypothetical protein
MNPVSQRIVVNIFEWFITYSYELVADFGIIFAMIDSIYFMNETWIPKETDAATYKFSLQESEESNSIFAFLNTWLYLESLPFGAVFRELFSSVGHTSTLHLISRGTRGDFNLLYWFHPPSSIPNTQRTDFVVAFVIVVVVVYCRYHTMVLVRFPHALPWPESSTADDFNFKKGWQDEKKKK